MRVIIAGSRTLYDMEIVKKAVKESGFDVTEVICGDARGVDQLGSSLAKLRGIPVSHFPADWNRFGPYAGPKRNEQMAKNADALIAVWDGKSRGTKNMIEQAKKRGLRVYVCVYTGYKDHHASKGLHEKV